MEENLKPKDGMEYLYRLDMVWKPNTMSKSFPIEINTVVVDVQHIKGSHYQFKNKETLELLECHYPWALAENTESNREKIKIFQSIDDEYNILDKKRTKALYNITTLPSFRFNETHQKINK